MTTSVKRWAALSLLLFACSNAGDGTTPQDALRVPVDTGLVPARATMDDGRAVARMMGPNGVAMDFVLGEVLIATDDTSKLADFVQRHAATVVESTPGTTSSLRLHRVRLDASGSDVERLLADVQQQAPDARGTFPVSSEAAAKLTALALAETQRNGMSVLLDFVAAPDDLRSGRTTEGTPPPVRREEGTEVAQPPLDAFGLSYLNSGSAQDTGVTAAWQMMDRAGLLQNKVRISIMDTDFALNPDFPPGALQGGGGGWRDSNRAGQCGSNPCGWHGTDVVQAAMGQLDNSFGGAGPAAPIAELYAETIPGDGTGLLISLERFARGEHAGARIGNMSWGFRLDLGWEIALKALCLGACPTVSEMFSSITRSAGDRLIFASAGNDSLDVDDGSANPEGSVTLPCEAANVICVGALGLHSAERAAYSNFGSRNGDEGVDIYAPGTVWVGPNPDSPNQYATTTNGTSFAAPFTAGVAALVWAAKPSLSGRQVWDAIRTNAHVGGIGDGIGNPLRINALAAVRSVLDTGAPTLTLNARPHADLNREWMVTASVTSNGAPCPTCTVQWSPTPTRTTGPTIAYYRFDVPVTALPVTATVTDVVGNTTSATLQVDVIDTPSVATISAPANGASVQQGVPVQLLGSRTDLNYGPDPGPNAYPTCRWESSNPIDNVSERFLGSDCDFMVTFTTVGERTLVLHNLGAGALLPPIETVAARVVIHVTAAPANLPPVIRVAPLPPSNYEQGYRGDIPIALSAAGTSDPENDTPITYTWTATSFAPNSAAVYAADVAIGSGVSLTWTPNASAGLIGTFGAIGNSCYDGQIVRIKVTATDSGGRASSRQLPDVKIFGCALE